MFAGGKRMCGSCKMKKERTKNTVVRKLLRHKNNISVWKKTWITLLGHCVNEIKMEKW